MAYPWLKTGLPDLSGVQAGPAPSFLNRPGLLDAILGGNNMQGVFSPEDQKLARQQGLLQGGLALMAASGRQPITRRRNFGEMLQEGLMAGQGGYQQALAGASQVQQMRAQQAEAQKAQQVEAATKALYNKYSQRIAAGDPKAAGEMMLEATSLGIPTGPISQLVQAYAGMQEKAPEDRFTTGNLGGKDVLYNQRTGQVLREENVPRPMGGGSGGGGGSFTPIQKFQMENSLGDDYQREIKTWDETGTLIGSALGAADLAIRGNGPATNQVVVAFVKALDPTSVAREGEVDLARKSGAILDRYRSQIDQLIAGKSAVLPEDVKRQMVALLRERQKTLTGRVVAKRRDYQTLSEDYQLRTNRLGLPSWAEDQGGEFFDVQGGASVPARQPGESIQAYQARIGRR